MNNEMFMAGPSVTLLEEGIVLDAVRNGWYGKQAYHYVETFESEFAAYHNRNFALMTPNCTTAIHLILTALGIKDNDEVIAPECTWIGSVAGIEYLRAKPVFADIDPNNWCLCPHSLEKNINPKTKAAIVVDLYGNMPEMEQLQQLCDERGIYLIEDAAEALGSTYNNIKAGKFGVASVFSFHRTKTITTGEGGMLLLDDEELYERCKFLRDHGRKPGEYFNTEVTYKYMPSNLAAALGYAQFRRLDELVAKKRWIWQTYSKYLADVPDLFLNPEPQNVHNGVWCTGIVLGKSHQIQKQQLMDNLTELGLPVRPFFYPLSLLPAFGAKVSEGKQRNPVAYDISERGINVPSAYNITEEQIATYCDGLQQVLGCCNQQRKQKNLGKVS
jgi:perosamine synthetase